MKHFGIYRKLILIIGTATAVVSVGVFFFMEDILFRTLFISFAFVFFGGLLFLLDFLHNRYNDNLLEEITLLIEALVEQQERTVFSDPDRTAAASTSKTPQYFKGTESNADTRERTDQNFNL